MAEGTVQLPADGVGSKLRTKTRTISAATVHEQQFTVAADDTWYVWSGSLACAANKYFLSILNTGAQVFRVQGLYLVNTTAAAVTGVACQFDIKKVTAVTVGTGTSLTAVAMDSADTAIASMTLAATAQTVTDGAVLYSYWTNNDEIGATNGFPTTNLQAAANLLPDLPGTKKPVLRVNEGLAVKQITSSVIGTFGVLAVITKDPQVSVAWEFPWMSGAWAAGSALTKSLADSVTATDGTPAKTFGKRGVADTATATDGTARSVVSARTDSVTASDLASKRVVAAKTDSVAPTDVSAADSPLKLTYVATRSESVTVTDVASRASAYKPHPSDQVSVTDVATTHVTQAYTQSLDDSVAVSDSTSAITTRVLALADTVTPTDEPTTRANRVQVVPANQGTLTLAPKTLEGPL